MNYTYFKNNNELNINDAKGRIIINKRVHISIDHIRETETNTECL